MPAVSSSGGRRPPVRWMDRWHARIAVDAIANGVRKIAIEQQELQNAVGREVGRIHLAIGFKRSAATQQPNQFEILVAGAIGLRAVEQVGLVDLQQRGRGVGPLEIAAKADELPALPVNHGGVADALEQVNAIHHRGQRVVDVGAELRLRMGRVNLVEEPVEPLPLLG